MGTVAVVSVAGVSPTARAADRTFGPHPAVGSPEGIACGCCVSGPVFPKPQEHPGGLFYFRLAIFDYDLTRSQSKIQNPKSKFRSVNMLDIAIIGASGYGGGELLRWLSWHPHARVVTATSNTYARQPVSAAFSGLAKRVNLAFSDGSDPAEAIRCPVVFLARDNGVAMGLAPELLAAGCKVIDLSADFRFRDPATYEAWYKTAHKSPDLSRAAVYGLPELHKEEIKKAQIVGNPGCYTTTAILALAPLLAERVASDSRLTTHDSRLLVDPATILVDAKSGVSGAGRSKFGPDYHFAEANESVTAYKAGGTHRHTPEIEQELSLLAGQSITISFTPHLIPMTRGILATCYATLTESVTADDLREHYRAFYADAPFVHVTDGLPATKHTLGTNMCHIGLAVDRRTNRVTVVSATDNLGKGMVGQAIQNMNLMCGFEETAGLEMPGMWP
jgi:N-acetyl-gamma-glutamyl-phosphate reductase